mmetsp:Transcript_10668/g.30439  ORF Transcript_10668/g.30439 Transcript_10668/m.30439 type:complete len:83 (+) Transcript_10668:124-372(+)
MIELCLNMLIKPVLSFEIDAFAARREMIFKVFYMLSGVSSSPQCSIFRVIFKRVALHLFAVQATCRRAPTLAEGRVQSSWLA